MLQIDITEIVVHEGDEPVAVIGFLDSEALAGELAHDKIMRCLELFGRKVIPLAQEMLASS